MHHRIMVGEQNIVCSCGYEQGQITGATAKHLAYIHARRNLHNSTVIDTRGMDSQELKELIK